MPEGSTRERLFRKVVARAITSPVSLFLSTTALLLIPTPDGWPLGFGALSAELVWVWTRIRNPAHAAASQDELLQTRWRNLIRRLEELSAALDAETAALLSGIVEAQERLLTMYDAGPALMPGTRAEVTALLDQCLSLAEKRRELQGFLSGVRSHEVQRQAMQLQQRLEQTHDPVTRQLFEEALRQKQQELENYVRLHDAVNRIDGQLEAVRCTFDNMLSRVARMQAGEAAVLSGTTADPLHDELNRLSRGVEALENSLTETLTLRGAL